MRFIVIAALAAFASLQAAAAEEEEPPFVPAASLEELDSRIKEALGDSEVGVQVALVDATGATWARAYGLRDRAAKLPAENDTIFRAGSISKSFTGALARMLVEDGVLDLNAKLRDVVPEIEFTNKWEDTDPVRLVHLSEHTTGWDDIQFSEYRDFGPDVTLLEGLAANPISRTSRWRPGRYSSYCNAGPVALAAAIERLTGRKFEDLVSERIFVPLGIGEASFLKTDEIAAKISKSYNAKGIEEPYVHIGLRPSGSLNISASELAKFVALLIRRGEANGEEIISPEGVARMETPSTTLAAKAGLTQGYGLGVYASYVEDRLFYGHTGGIDGFVSQYGYSHATGTGFVVMANTADGEPLLAVRKLVATYLLAQPPAAPAADVDLAKYEGYYRQITPRTEFARALVDAMDFTNVYADGKTLVVAPPFGEGPKLTPVGGDLFTAEGRGEADRIFLATPEGAFEMHRNFQNAYRRVSMIDAYWRVVLLGAVALAGALALLTTLVWVLARPFGAFRNSNRWRVWTWPLLAYASLGVAAGAFMLGAEGNSAAFTAKLGGPSLYSWSIAAATWLFVLFAALGIAGAFRARGASGFARFHAGLTSLILAGFAVYLWSYGWIGMTIWSYRPTVFGS